MKRLANFVAFSFLVVFVAALLRMPRLEQRPMHADEAVQAARFRDLWQQGRFVYDPNEFHGPTLVYATWPSVVWGDAEDFAETTKSTYRRVTVIFGLGVVLLFLCFRQPLGALAAAAAALLAAVSPAMVFYSRYYIHESLLAFFTLAAIACGWRYFTSRKWVWCLLAATSIGMMQGTKETAVIAYFAAGFASLVLWWDLRRQAPEKVSQDGFPWRQVMAGSLVACAVAAILLSSFFTNWRGVIDGLFLTYLPWWNRAAGASPHLHPWWFYLQRLAWWHVDGKHYSSEGLIIVLAAVAVVRAWGARWRGCKDHRLDLLRWLSVYTAVMIVFYSAIPYKTPWCLLQFLTGMILLAGAGAAVLITSVQSMSLRTIIAALLLLGAGHLGWQAYRASFVFPADAGNPYTYVQTSQDVERLAEQLDQLAATHPEGHDMPVKVIWTDAYYWPLPWYLRRFEAPQLWRRMPSDPAAPVVVASPRYDRELTEALGDGYLMTGYYELRPQVLLQLWVEYDLWENYLRRLGRIP